MATRRNSTGRAKEPPPPPTPEEIEAARLRQIRERQHAAVSAFYQRVRQEHVPMFEATTPEVNAFRSFMAIEPLPKQTLLWRLCAGMFVAPRFQRPFGWSRAECLSFMESVHEVMMPSFVGWSPVEHGREGALGDPIIPEGTPWYPWASSYMPRIEHEGAVIESPHLFNSGSCYLIDGLHRMRVLGQAATGVQCTKYPEFLAYSLRDRRWVWSETSPAQDPNLLSLPVDGDVASMRKNPAGDFTPLSSLTDPDHLPEEVKPWDIWAAAHRKLYKQWLRYPGHMPYLMTLRSPRLRDALDTIRGLNQGLSFTPEDFDRLLLFSDAMEGILQEDPCVP